MRQLEDMKKKELIDLNELSISHHPWLLKIISIFAATFMIFVGLLLWVIFFQSPAVTYPDLPWPIIDDDHIFVPGELVPLKVTRCNNTSHTIIYTLTRAIKNMDTDRTYVFPSTRVSIDPGCHSDVSRLHQLPAELISGTYRIQGEAEVPGTINTKIVSFVSENFKVLQPSELPTGTVSNQFK